MILNPESLSKAADSIVSSYKDYITDKIDAAKDSIAKITALKRDLDWEDVSSGALDITDSFSDAVDLATAIGGAFASNPLVDQLMDEMSAKYGWDNSSGLGVIKALLGKECNSLVKVATAMLKLPATTAKYMLVVNIVIDTAGSLLAALEAEVPNLNNISGEFGTTSTINPDIPAYLGQAKAFLSKSLISSPFDSATYDQATSKIDDALELLKEAKVWVNPTAADYAGIMVHQGIMGLRTLMETHLIEIKKADTDFLVTLSAIRNTVVEKKESNASLATPRRARIDIAKIIGDMNNTKLDQSLMLAQYLIALGAVRKVLQYSKPTEADPPAAFPNSLIAFDSTKFIDVRRGIDRLYNFCKKPNRLDLLRAFIDDLTLKRDALQTEFNTLNADVLTLWTHMPGMQDLIEQILTWMNDEGLDAAAAALLSGDLDSIAEMSPFSATTMGAALLAVQNLEGFAEAYNIEPLQKWIKKFKKKFQKKAEAKNMDNEAKKKKKIAKITKSITDALAGIDELTVMGKELIGIIDVITSLSN